MRNLRYMVFRIVIPSTGALHKLSITRLLGPTYVASSGTCAFLSFNAFQRIFWAAFRRDNLTSNVKFQPFAIGSMPESTFNKLTLDHSQKPAIPEFQPAAKPLNLHFFSAFHALANQTKNKFRAERQHHLALASPCSTVRRNFLTIH